MPTNVCGINKFEKIKKKKNENLKTSSEAGIAVYTFISSTRITDVWFTPKFIAGNITWNRCDVIVKI